MLLNFERALRVMKKYDVDALVAREHINIYYLTNYWDTQADGRWPYLVYGLLPRDKNKPAALVLPSVKLDRLSLWPSWVPNVVVYSDYSGRENIAQTKTGTHEPTAASWTGWPVRENTRLTELEKKWIELATYHSKKLSATSTWGLKKALKEAGLETSRIATDDPRIIHWMREMGMPNIDVVDGTNIFREIRMVKTHEEISIIRKAAKINEAACLYAASKATNGEVWESIENFYHTYMSKHGGRNGHIITNLGGLPHGKIIQNSPFLVDALGEYKNYFGDFGRTIVVGEPTKELQIRSQALKAGFEAACEAIKPGIKKSSIIKLTVETVKKSGFPEFFYVSPHSLGLEHTDQPIPLGPSIHSNDTDFVVEENMVINIDMPYFEWGWGTMHLEDTVLVKKNGIEPLTSLSDPLIVNDKN